MKIQTHITHVLTDCTEEEARAFAAYEASFMGALQEYSNPHLTIGDIDWSGESEAQGYKGNPVKRAIRVQWHRPPVQAVRRQVG